MPRLRDTLLGPVGQAEFALAPMTDARQGAMNGFQSDKGGYVSNANYVKRNLIVILLEAPAGMRDLANGDVLIGTLKAAFEEHAQTWDGLNQTLEAEFNETPVGGAGEVQQDLVNMRRQRSEPQLTLPEKYGKPFSNLFRLWMTGIMMDPDSKYPTVINENNQNRPTDLLPDYMAATAIFIEPDPTHTFPVEAWLCTNMMPQSSGDITGRRDKTQAHEVPQLQITFTALTQVGAGVLQFAQALMDQMNLTGLNPNTRPAFMNAIDADVASQRTGYIDEVNNAPPGVQPA